MDWSKLREALEPEIKMREVADSDSEPTKSKVFDSYNTPESV